MRDFAGTRTASLAGLAAIVCTVGWFAVFPADASVTSDDGAYAIQAIHLAERGSWSVPHSVALADPDGLTYPFVNSAITERGYFTAGRQVAWVHALRVSYEVMGIRGLRVLPALGFSIAVAVSAALGRRFHGPSAGVLAGTLTLTSPLLFNGLQLWAHAPVAAAIACMMWCALGLFDSRVSFRLVCGAALAGAVASSLRPDGFIFAIGVVAVLGLSACRARSLTRILITALVGAGPLLAYAAVSLWASGILGSVDAVSATRSRATGDGIADFVSGRIAGGVHTFVSSGDEMVPLVLSIVAAGMVLAGVLALRRGDGLEGLILIGAAVVMWCVRLLHYPDAAVTGLIAAWPLALLCLVRRWRTLLPGERRLLAMAAVGALGVFLTQYADGGGFNWGGRFLSPAIPIIAVVAAGSLRLMPRYPGGPMVVVLTGLTVVLCVAALVFDGTVRTRHAAYVHRAERLTDAPVVTGVDALPRLAWRLHPHVEWVRLPPDMEETRGADELLRILDAAEVYRVYLFGVPRDAAAALSDGELDELVGFTPAEVHLPRR